MTRRRFFVDHVPPGEESVILNDRVTHHAETVLRLKPGDSVELCDGRGNLWHGVMGRSKGGNVCVQLLEKRQVRNEAALELTLALAFSRSDRMELVIRQAVEIGVHRLWAFRAQRSQYSLSGSQIGKRKARWLKIATEALCQCGRTRLPEVLILSDVEDLIANAATWENDGNPGLKILAREDENEQSLFGLWRLFPSVKRVLAVVGPEGGWAGEDMERFLKAGYHPVHLGPRVLRLETAALAFLASTQLLWGDLG